MKKLHNNEIVNIKNPSPNESSISRMSIDFDFKRVAVRSLACSLAVNDGLRSLNK